MLNFYYPELKDRDWVQPILSASGGLGSEHAFGTMYVWRWTYCRRICRYKDFLLSGFGKDLRAYVVPEGTGDLREAVEVLIEDAKERGIPFRLWGVTKERLEEYESLFPGKFDYLPLRDDADYLYRSEDLIQLAGRKLHGKRNHLAQFNRSYQWTYEEVSRENFKDCMAVAHEWCLKHGSCGEDGHSEENCAVAAALHGFEPLGMKGGLIRKALGVEELPIEVGETKVSFPWFAGTPTPEEVKAYDHFICALCEMARNQKRITAKERDTGNDKYAFRCFLLRLGFIGPEYKQERKILLRNLTGSSAFKAVPQKEVADDAAPE